MSHVLPLSGVGCSKWCAWRRCICNGQQQKCTLWSGNVRDSLGTSSAQLSIHMFVSEPYTSIFLWVEQKRVVHILVYLFFPYLPIFIQSFKIYQYNSIYGGFGKIGVPPVTIHSNRWDFPWNKPTILGIPMTMETSISRPIIQYHMHPMFIPYSSNHPMIVNINITIVQYLEVS